MKNTKLTGIITEQKIELWFLERGYDVSVPIGDNSRYDFIVDLDGKLVRFQSKTCNKTRVAGCLNFATASMKVSRSKNYRQRYTQQEIDYFCTINADTNQVYIVPVEECGNEFNLRIIPPKNGQIKNCHMATDYEGEKMIERILNS